MEFHDRIEIVIEARKDKVALIVFINFLLKVLDKNSEFDKYDSTPLTVTATLDKRRGNT